MILDTIHHNTSCNGPQTESDSLQLAVGLFKVIVYFAHYVNIYIYNSI